MATQYSLHKQPLLKAVAFDGYTFALLLAYFPGINVVCKEHGGFFEYEKGKYHRYWYYDRSIIETTGEKLFAALLAAAPGNIGEQLDEIKSKIEAARAAVDPSAFTEKLQYRIASLEDGDVLLNGSFHRGAVALVKRMTRAARFIGSMKAWRLPGVSPLMLRNNLLGELQLREEQVVIDDSVYEIAENGKLSKKGHIRVLDSAKVETGLDEEGNFFEEEDDGIYLAATSPLEPTSYTDEQIDAGLARYSLYEYQGPGVRHLVTKSSALLADDMGLGKTRQAVVAADMLIHWQGGKSLVICPASLLINWRREIAAVDPEGKVAVQQWDPEAKWIITNYEQVECLLPYADQFRVMTIDEAHFLKDPTTIRTRLAFDLAAKIPHRYLLTGTPILNRESEIHTLLRLSGHPLGNVSLKEFVKEFSGSPEFRSELNARMGEWMLRRRKEVVLSHLKGKQHHPQYIALSSEQREDYNRVMFDQNMVALAKITRLRQLLEATKIDYARDMVAKMGEEDKVLIFCEYKETVAVLLEQFELLGIKAVSVTGSDTAKRRQAAVDAFQDDPEVRVFLGTTRAAGVGINLTAANYVIFITLPWTPALKEQAEDRAYRNGQIRLVIAMALLAEDSIDMDLWEMLKYKKGLAVDIMDPTMAEDAAMSEFAAQLSPSKEGDFASAGAPFI